MIVAAIAHLALSRAAPRLIRLRWRGERLVRRITGRRLVGRALSGRRGVRVPLGGEGAVGVRAVRRSFRLGVPEQHENPGRLARLSGRAAAGPTGVRHVDLPPPPGSGWVSGAVAILRYDPSTVRFGPVPVPPNQLA